MVRETGGRVDGGWEELQEALGGEEVREDQVHSLT